MPPTALQNSRKAHFLGRVTRPDVFFCGKAVVKIVLRSWNARHKTENRTIEMFSKNSEIVSVCSFSWERFRFYFSMIAALEFRRFDRCIVNVTFDVCDEVNIMQSAARVAVNL
jgi:hypothetical protein